MLYAVEVVAVVAFALSWAQIGWVDWTEQKIRNRYLGRWLALAAAAYAGLLLHTVLGERGYFASYIVRSYYPAVLAYAAASAGAAYALWSLRVWPAGDVKLYVLLALYLPLMRVPLAFHSGLRFLEVLINTFIPAAAFLFVTAGWYVWQTRFRHQSEFMTRLGPARLARFLADKLVESWPAVRAELAAWVEGYRAQPLTLGRDLLNWLASVLMMSLISYSLGDLVRSNFVKTLLCFALFFLWSRFSMAVGRNRMLALTVAGLGLLFWLRPDTQWRAFAYAFGHISVFSLFIFFGVQIAFKVVAGQTGFVFLPFLFMLTGLIPWHSLTGMLAPSYWLPDAAESVLAGTAVWAGMGLFFGLSLVFVRIWDAESYKSVPLKEMKPFMNLGPELAERLRADEEFFAEHIGTLYADGLTAEQVEALRSWCRRERLAVVPLAPTMSFANWIFIGYVLTWLLDGHVLNLVYR